MNDTDARLWHPWLPINRVLRVMVHTRWSASPFCGPRRDADCWLFELPSAIMEDQEG